MLERLCKRFVVELLHEGIISENDAEVYYYGLFQLAMLFLNVGTTAVLAIAFHAVIPCIMLNLSYIPLRISAGGHHASTPSRCYMNSTIMMAVLLAIMKWLPIHPYIAIGMLIFASIVVWRLAPVETADDPFDAVERKVYRMRSIFVLLIEILVYGLLLFFCKKMFADSIVLGVFTESIMLLLGWLKLRKKRL